MKWFRYLDGRHDSMRPPIKILPHVPGAVAVELKRGYSGDAGFDLACSEAFDVLPGEYAEISCGFDIELPEGVWALIHSRSSTMARGLVVNTSVIDNGYRGPMFVGVWNRNRPPALGRPGSDRDTVHVEKGDRLAQLLPMPLLAAEMQIEVVDQLSRSDRGNRGFGSTGT